MAAVLMIGYMFLSAMAIVIWSGPRVGPKWVTFFGHFGPSETSRPIPRRSAIVCAAAGATFELVVAYAALQPDFLPVGGSLVLAIQIGLALLWTTYFARLARRASATRGARREL
jgi:hypothetical protein